MSTLASAPIMSRTPAKPRQRALRAKAAYVARLVWGRLTGRRFPLETFLNLTNRCNLDCTYCFGDYHHRVRERDYSTGEILRLIDVIGQRGGCLLHLQGGEPLLRNDLQTVIRRGHSRGMLVDLNTNGTFIDRRRDDLKELDAICFSIDGPEEITDRTRGRGVYAGVLHGIGVARELGLPTRINMVLSRHTAFPENLRWMATFARQHNLILNLSVTYLPRAGRQMDEYCADESQLRTALTTAIQLRQEGFPIQYSPRSFEFAKNWPLPFIDPILADNHPAARTISAPDCRFPQFMCFIEADGTLFPCFQQCATAFKPKNWLEDGFDVAWEHVQNVSCRSCAEVSYQERNRIFALSLPILLNNILITLRYNMLSIGGGS